FFPYTTLFRSYRVLKDEAVRHAYDSQRAQPLEAAAFTSSSAPPARDIGLFGQGLSALLCLLMGLFLLVLVRSQWIWFLWPLTILAAFVIIFGVLLAHSAMLSINESLASSNPLRGR